MAGNQPDYRALFGFLLPCLLAGEIPRVTLDFILIRSNFIMIRLEIFQISEGDLWNDCLGSLEPRTSCSRYPPFEPPSS